LVARLNEVEARVGPEHEVVVKLQRKMEELLSAIREEELRITDSYANEYELAKAREKQLAASLAQLVGETEIGSQAQVKMRELESSADTVRSLYNSFLQKFNEISTIQSQNVPVQDARIVTRAAPQLQTSKKSVAALAGGLIFGLLMGAGAAMAREWAADVFRTPKKVEQVTNKACVILPMVRAQREPGERFWSSSRSQPIEEFILDAPYSRFTESLRNIKALIDIGPRVEGAKVVGIVSSVAKEGKTTIAANLAALYDRVIGCPYSDHRRRSSSAAADRCIGARSRSGIDRGARRSVGAFLIHLQTGALGAACFALCPFGSRSQCGGAARLGEDGAAVGSCAQGLRLHHHRGRAYHVGR
jgi:succinoglycan biosynthesis transport protein ExoP